MTIELIGLEDIPIVDSSSDIAQIIRDALLKQGCGIEHGDIILIAETLISKAEDNFIRLDELNPSKEAIELAEKSKKDEAKKKDDKASKSKDTKKPVKDAKKPATADKGKKDAKKPASGKKPAAGKKPGGRDPGYGPRPGGGHGRGIHQRGGAGCNGWPDPL